MSAVVVVFILFAFTDSVFAYPLQGTQDQTTGTSFQMPSLNLDWLGNAWNTLSASVSNVINGAMSSFNNNSMNSIGNTVSNIQIGGANNNQFTIGGAYQNFDNLLYGVAGFHISEFFNAVVSVAIWLLNLAKNIINWLLSFVH